MKKILTLFFLALFRHSFVLASLPETTQFNLTDLSADELSELNAGKVLTIDEKNNDEFWAFVKKFSPTLNGTWELQVKDFSSTVPVDPKVEIFYSTDCARGPFSYHSQGTDPRIKPTNIGRSNSGEGILSFEVKVEKKQFQFWGKQTTPDRFEGVFHVMRGSDEFKATLTRKSKTSDLIARPISVVLNSKIFLIGKEKIQAIRHPDFGKADGVFFKHKDLNGWSTCYETDYSSSFSYHSHPFMGFTFETFVPKSSTTGVMEAKTILYQTEPKEIMTLEAENGSVSYIFK